MKIKITLTDYEIRNVIEKAILEKVKDASFYAHHIKLNGSVKFKGRYIRKDIKRMIASVEFSK